MSLTIPTSWDDIEPWLINATKAHFAPVPVANKKPTQEAPYKCVVIRGDLQQRVTPISRYARIGIQAWSITDSQESDFPAARTLAGGFGTYLEQILNDMSTSGPFLTAEVESGPLRVVDPESKHEYALVNVLAEVHAA